MIDGDINVERLARVPTSQLEKGVKRIDPYLDMHVGRDTKKAYSRVGAVLDKAYSMDPGGTCWDGGSDDSSAISIGIDIDDDKQMIVLVEEHTQKSVDVMMGEMVVDTSFKQFLKRDVHERL